MKEFKSYFIYVGNAYPHKNLKRLIEAIVLLNKEIKENVGLVIVSARNVFTWRLQKLVNRLNAEKHIRLLGFLPDERLDELYKNSQAFVFPSISEGFGLPGLEAMASGTLVLASNIAVFREIYKKNAIYFNPKNLFSMINIMRKALNMADRERQKRIENAKKFAKHYSWSKMAQETLKVYEDCNSL